MAEIIIADPDVAMAGALAAVISEGDRHVVAVASTAADVLSAAGGATSPAVCLLDRWFDDGDALDLLVRLHARSPATKVVVLAADPDRDVVQQALDQGAHGFVHKTRGVSALLGAIERILVGATVVELPPRWRVSGPAEASPTR
jgi:two-component system, NarL family, nitrate/nitrite response regulator NarL